MSGTTVGGTKVVDPGSIEGQATDVTVGPTAAQQATYDPRPTAPNTDFEDPDPSGGVPLPANPQAAWTRSVDAAVVKCPNADADPVTTPVAKVRTATVCLLNEERAKQSLGRVRQNKQLLLAANRHARDMVKRSYFSHYSLNGTNFVTRLTRSHYVAHGYRWSVGENLAWGANGQGTPRMIVRAWMGSPPHRANVLNRQFREIGMGIIRGAPAAGQTDATTYASEYGARRRLR